MASSRNSRHQEYKQFEKVADVMISSQNNDAQVEELLQEMNDRSLLSLRIGSHTIRNGTQYDKAVQDLSRYENLSETQPDNEGLEGDLVARFLELKRGPSKGPSPISSNKASEKTAAKTMSSSAGTEESMAPDSEDVDTLGNDLASRLQALKASNKVPSGQSPVGFGSNDMVPPVVGPGSATEPSSMSSPPLPPLRPQKTRDESRANGSRPQNLDKSLRTLPRNSKAGSSGAGLRNLPRKLPLHMSGHDGVLDEADGLMSSGSRQYSTSRSFWGKGRRRTVDTTGEMDGDTGHGLELPLKDILLREERERGGEDDVDEKEVDSLLRAMSDEFYLQSKQTSLPHSVASVSGYLCEDDEWDSEASDINFVEQEVDGIIEWAKDAVTLEEKAGNHPPPGQDEKDGLGLALSQREEGSLQNRTWKDLENERDDHGYSQDDEEGESVRKGKGTGNAKERKS